MYCTACNTPVIATFKLCPKCGNRTFSDSPVAVRAANVPANSGSQTTTTPSVTYQKVSSQQPAGFWIRFGAYLIDIILLQLITLLIYIPLVLLHVIEYSLLGQDSKQAIGSALGLEMLIAIVVSWLYFALQESSAKCATFGKRIVGIKVSPLTGDQISFGQSSGRYWLKCFQFIALGLPFFLIAFRRDKRGFHDLAVNTQVCHTK